MTYLAQDDNWFWITIQTVILSLSKKAYSYGDSAGFTPDFPFNPAIAGTNYVANVTDGKMNYKIILCTRCAFIFYMLFLRQGYIGERSTIKDLFFEVGI